MTAGIKDILIITNSENLYAMKKLLGDGSRFGLQLSFKEQIKAEGIAQAFTIGEQFIGKNNVALILGDNIFFGANFSAILEKVDKINKPTIFTYEISDPSSFGIVELNKRGRPIKIIEKPKKFFSNLCVTGLYFFNNDVVNIAKKLKKSKRGEYEITDINNVYIKKQRLNIEKLNRGFTWLDAGSPEGIINASQFIRSIEKKQGLKIACLEEIALRNNWINKSDIKLLLKENSNSEYYEYIKKIVNYFK